MPPVASEPRERLFIGVPVPDATRSSLIKKLPSVLPGRPVPPENWHFTLRFLGSTEIPRRERMIESLDTTRFGPPFEIEFDKLGAFPNPRRARVLWLGVGRGHEKLEAVAARAEAAAMKAGFDAEPRNFTAHLTLSRMREPGQVSELVASSRQIGAVMRVDEVVLFRSEAGGEHSRYTVVAAFPLR